MNDAKILSAIKALHERFVEEPTEQKVEHLKKFIRGSEHDLTYPASQKCFWYLGAVIAVGNANFSPVSLAHLNEVAKENLG